MKSVNAWCVVDPHGNIKFNTVGLSEKRCKEYSEKSTKWCKDGYYFEAVPVQITEVTDEQE